MMYSPGISAVMPPLVGTFTSGVSPAASELAITGAAASSAWESANVGAYFPILIPSACVVRRLWWANGATVSASYNVDCGLYLDSGYKPGARLISAGSTAQGTASEVQFVDVTDTTLAPGRYWIGMSCSSASATFFRAQTGASVAYSDAVFRFQENTSSMPLPATATPAESTNTNVYLCGFATTASP
jgi:hypothetical protein